MNEIGNTDVIRIRPDEYESIISEDYSTIIRKSL